MSNIFEVYKYDKNATKKSPIAKDSLVEYDSLVKREGGSTYVKNVYVIDMDDIKNKQNLNPMPSSMDITFLISNTNENLGEKVKKYILVDFKFKVTAVNKVDNNITNKKIKDKFEWSYNFIHSNDFNVSIDDTAYFVFNNNQFEQIRNAWGRRHLNSPKNRAVKQSDFEKLFEAV